MADESSFCTCSTLQEVDQALKKAEILAAIAPSPNITARVDELAGIRADVLRAARPCGGTPEAGVCLFGEI
jgi:hypothetical protein